MLVYLLIAAQPTSNQEDPHRLEFTEKRVQNEPYYDSPQLLELFHIEPRVFKDLAHSAFRHVFSRMNGYSCPSSIGMPIYGVAPALPN